MVLSQGSRVGPYEVLAPIGAGGMGEVFRARDSRLNREVAIKVLPAAFVNDRERVARFRREAQVVASLNHPNIAAIHGIEESNGVLALALELVEGEDLAERLLRGPIPIKEALDIARQIAEGMEWAHERGIVHRDLKPANVKLTADGGVKILDFGLARAALDAEGAGSEASLANSPTMARPMTESGMILGTAAYMSPEQARGKAVDKRSDIWSFGVVLYEMLTGRRLFTGETVSDVLAAVLTREPEWSALPADVSPRILLLLQRCLERDPRQRLRDLGEARVELARPDILQTAPSVKSPAKRRGAWLLAASAALAIVAVFAAWKAWPGRSADRRALRLAFLPPDGVAFDPGSFHSAAISPDGLKIVFSGRGADGRRQLFMTRLASGETRPLPDTFEALEPFWSPDSESVGFGANGKLKRIDLQGTQALTLSDAPRLGVGAVWSSGNVILFSPDFGAGLYRIPASGGTPEVAVAATGRYDRNPFLPSFLPDGRHFLYNEGLDPGGRVIVASLDSKTTTVIENVKTPATFLAPGFLLLVINGELAVQPFDSESFRVTGSPRNTGIARMNRIRSRLTTSDDGILVAPEIHSQTTQLVWVDRQGKALGSLEHAEPRTVPQMPVLSPDGRFVLVQRRDDVASNQDLWILDVARGTASRLTTDPELDQIPMWSPSGASVYFNARREGRPGIYRVAATGGEETLILEGIHWPGAMTPDERLLLFYRRGEHSRVDLWALPLTGGGKPYPLIASPFEEMAPALSPDGRWLAYASDVTGMTEIYVCALTAEGRMGPATRVTTAGGRSPRWRGDGKELFFLAGPLNPDEEPFSAVDVKISGSSIELGTPQVLFKMRTSPFFTSFPYSVSADGQSFLVDAAVGSTHPPAVRMYLNWMPSPRTGGPALP